MFPFWAPLSSVTIDTPPLPVTGFVLRRMLGRGRPISLTYRGDRMHPALSHGQTVEVRPLAGDLLPGAVVLALPDNIPDLLRVVAAGPDGVVLAGDADPASPFAVAPDRILALTDLPRRRSGRWQRVARRLRIDLREARGVWTSASADPAESVRGKYDEQAPSYGHGRSGGRAWPLEARVLDAVAGGGRILVAGSGAGFECFRLEQLGFEVIGIDFSPRMVAIAREAAARQGSGVRFAEADLRSHAEPDGSLDAVVFTFDVYSFIPGRSTRMGVLARMRDWLRPGGVIYLSARRIDGLYSRAVLACPRVGQGALLQREFGDTHTRWIGTQGEVERSFVKCFTARALAAEIREAGLEAGPWDAGHGELRAPAARH